MHHQSLRVPKVEIATCGSSVENYMRYMALKRECLPSKTSEHEANEHLHFKTVPATAILVILYPCLWPPEWSHTGKNFLSYINQYLSLLMSGKPEKWSLLTFRVTCWLPIQRAYGKRHGCRTMSCPQKTQQKKTLSTTNDTRMIYPFGAW